MSNEDYFVIGTYQAKELLDEYGTFEAIEKVRQYELSNFGESITEVDPEKSPICLLTLSVRNGSKNRPYLMNVGIGNLPKRT